MNKVNLNDFVKEEVNNHTRNIIVSSIKEGKQSKKNREELIFNKYSLEILFEENRIIIYDDVFSEDEPLEISLDDFINSVTL